VAIKAKHGRYSQIPFGMVVAASGLHWIVASRENVDFRLAGGCDAGLIADELDQSPSLGFWQCEFDSLLGEGVLGIDISQG
jgi:hypothetical protein